MKLQEMEEAAKKTRRSSSRYGSRKPLSDCINTINSINPSQSQTSSSASTKNPTISLIKPTKFLNSNKPSNAQSKGGKIDNVSSNPSADGVPSISTPVRTRKPYSTNGTDGASHEVSEQSVYRRRQSADKSKGKQKAISEPMSCFPALKTKVSRDETIGGVPTLSKSCMLPYKKKRSRTTFNEDDANYALPQDFIERQRAYFAEIDAFELPEEEVDSIDELD